MYITTCIIDWKCLKLIQMAVVLQLAKVAMAPKLIILTTSLKKHVLGEMFWTGRSVHSESASRL